MPLVARHCTLVASLALLGCSFDAKGKGDGGSGTGGSTGTSDTGGSGITETVGSGGTQSLDGSGSGGSADGGSSTGDPEPSPILAHFDTFSAPMNAGIASVGGVGFEPKAVLFWITDHAGEGVLDGAILGRGWTDGTHDGAVATAWAHGSSATRGRWIDDACVTLVDPMADLLADPLAEASIEGFDDDGFSLNWSVPGQGRQVAFLALGGPIEARVGNEVFSLDSEPIKGVGFMPDVVLFAGVETVLSPGTEDRGGHGFGVGLAEGPDHGSAHLEQDSDAGRSGLSQGTALITADPMSDPNDSFELAGVDADGFTLDRQMGSNAIGSTWLALRGLDVSAGVITQPDALGLLPVRVGFDPVVVMFDGGDKASGWYAEPELVHGVAVPGGSQGALWMGRFGTSTRSIWNLERALTSHDADDPGTAWAQASVSATDATGFTLNWTTVADDTARQIGWLALGSLR